MVRKYERVTGRHCWSEEEMSRAVATVLSGKMGYKLAAKTFHIPRSTLQRRASKMRSIVNGDRDAHAAGAGAAPPVPHCRRVFTDQQEQHLVDYIKSMQQYFTVISKRDIRELAFQYAEDNSLVHPFDTFSRMAGEEWVKNFLKRNPDLVFRAAENDAEAVNFDQYYHFMTQL